MFFFAIGKLFEGREQLLKASHVVLQYDCHLLGTAQSIQRQSTYRSVTLSADEDIAAMCQVLYMDQAQHIQFKTPLLFSAGLYTELAALPVRVNSNPQAEALPCCRSYILCSRWNPSVSSHALLLYFTIGKQRMSFLRGQKNPVVSSCHICMG